MQEIRKQYAYNHVHDAASLQTILKELSGADGVRELKDAPAPSAGTAHAVSESVSYLQAMMDEDTESEYTESAFGTSTDSDSSEETRKPRSRDRDHKKSHRSKSRGGKEKSKKDKKDKKEKVENKCPHCKKFQRTKPHRVDPDKCMWNKKYKGYRFKLICDELEVDFKPRHKFSAELGGYVEAKESDSE